MNKSPSHLELFAPCFGSPGAAADSIAGFDQKHTQVAIQRKITGSNESGETCTDNDHIVRTSSANGSRNNSVCW